jgi:hypothetical protein
LFLEVTFGPSGLALGFLCGAGLGLVGAVLSSSYWFFVLSPVDPLPFGLSFGPSLLGLGALLAFGLFVSFAFPFFLGGRFAV